MYAAQLQSEKCGANIVFFVFTLLPWKQLT